MTETNTNTTEKISQLLTPKSTLLNNLIKSYQKTPLTEQQAKKLNLPSTPKSKCRLGINDDRKIIWPTPNFTPDDHSILTAFGKSQDIELDDLLGSIIMTWFETNREQITKESDDFIKTENSTDDLLKIADAAKRKYNRTMAELASRMAPTQTTSADPADTSTTETTYEEEKEIITNILTEIKNDKSKK